MGGHTWESGILPTYCRHLCMPTPGGEGQDVNASAARNATITSFESVNYQTLAACVSLYWESKLTPFPLHSLRWGLCLV